MEALMLYVDMRYVIGIQCTDGIPKSIVLPNREERIWLFFYEDINHDKIVYSKNNESHYLNNEPHYFGDVFPKILDSRIEFTRFRRKKALRDIFYESKMFEDLKTPFSTEQNIETFVSFSADVPLAARSIFLEELGVAGFSVKLSVARIEHLALENAKNKNLIFEEGQYLVLNACNENLHYSLYDNTGRIFVRKDQDKLEGLGTDLRGRALVEEVVKKANIGNHYLETPNDFNLEYQRMTQLFLSKWILKLDNARNNIPIAIDNVWFAAAPNNKQTIQIKKKDIDEHTKAIVDDIVRKLGGFVSKAGSKEMLKGLLLIGDTFSNSMFESALNEQFNCSSKPIIRYRISEIKDIVSTYPYLDLEQFSADAKLFSNNAEAERIRIENAIREEEERQKAAQEQEEREQRERAAYDAEKMYNVEMQGVYEYETKKDYVRMLESCEAALKHKPNDAEALKKKKEAERCIAQEDVKSEQYNNAIKKAKECYDAGQYKDALFHSESALNLRTDSSEAKRIRDNSQKILDTQARIEKFTTRADLFIGQKLYDQAASELQKILTIDPNNKVAKKKLNEIKTILQKAQKEIDNLVEQLKKSESDEDYNKAIALCEKLKAVDSSNVSKWGNEINRLKEVSEKTEKERELLSDLRKKINAANFEEQWDMVAKLCMEYLRIRPDDGISSRLEKANVQLKEKAEEKQFQEGLSVVKERITEKKWKEAEDALNKLQKQFPDKESICKKLRVIIFSGQDESEVNNPKVSKRVKPQPNEKDFFDEDFPKRKATKTGAIVKSATWFDEDFAKKPSETQKKAHHHDNESKKTIGNDFFDEDSVSANRQSESKRKDDFFELESVKSQTGDDFFDNNSKSHFNYDCVHSSVLAPIEVKRKSQLCIQVYLHRIEETNSVIANAKRIQPNTGHRDTITLPTPIIKGEKVEVLVNIFGESLLMSNKKCVVWPGSYTKCIFNYYVPDNIGINELSCWVLLSVNGIPVGEMCFTTKIVETPRLLEQEIKAHKYNKVFVSYSHIDEDKVKFLHEGLKVGSIPHFFDRSSLKPGDVFPKVIQEYIETSDLFILCWSENASKSEYVAKELEQALDRAFPKVQPLEAAKLTIYPISIEPRADLPINMRNQYYFGKM